MLKPVIASASRRLKTIVPTPSLLKKAACILAGVGVSFGTVSADLIQWNQSLGGDFNTAANWDPEMVPVAGDLAMFSIATGDVTLSSAAVLDSILFTGGASSFALGTLGGNGLTLGDGGSITVSSSLAGIGRTFTINAPLLLNPQSATTAGIFSLLNDATASSNILVVAGDISAGTTSATETLTLGGSNTGANLVSGAISNGAAASLALIKSGAGTWTLSGANTYTGGTSISEGTLALSGGNNRLLSTSAVSFNGPSGALDMGATSQTLAGLTFLAGSLNNQYVINGTGGALVVTGGNFEVGGGSAAAQSVVTNVNMSALGSFTFNRAAGIFNVGGTTNVGNVAITGNATVTLAAVNTITAASFNVGHYTTGVDSLNSGTVHLGQTNTINANAIVVGISKTTATVDFQNLTTPTLKIRGTLGTDTDRAQITVGSNDSGLTATVATFDLTNGGTVSSTLDAKVSTLRIGQNNRNNTTVGRAATGTFSMGLGTLDATTIIVGQQGALSGANTFSGAATGTFNISGGTVIATTLTLADKLSGAAVQTITSNLNLYSGTLSATTIQRGTSGTGAGANTATINFNWVDGTISNINGVNQTVSGKTAVNGLTGGLNIVLNNTGNVSGTHIWNVGGTQTSTLENTVTLSGAGSLRKTGTGTLVFQGTNTYAGATEVTAGTVRFATRGGLYNGDTTKWTSSNLVVSSGATAAFNVGGSGEFTVQDIDLLSSLGTTTGGFQSGSFIGLDATNAVGNFVYNLALTNTDNGPNVLGLVKLGTGTLELTAANTYTGGTNIVAGTLALSGGNDRLYRAGVLNFTGSSGTLDVGSTNQSLGGMTFGIAGTNNYTITGASGTLSVTAGNLHIGGGGVGSTGANPTTVNMTGLGTFNYVNTSGTFSVGGRADIGAAVSSAGTLLMAANTNITATKFSVSPVSSGNSSPNTGTVRMGQNTVINASTIEVGVGKATSVLDFQTSLLNPTLKIRGTGGTDTDRAAITLGIHDSGVIGNTSTVDLVTGVAGASTLDAMVSTLMIAQNVRNGAAGTPTTATFTMGQGTMNATSIVIGQQNAVTGSNSSGNATGTLSLHGGTITTGTLTLANKLATATAQTITSNFNLYSGALYATTIERGAVGTGAGADTATINFNWVDGTIGNIAGANQTVDGKSVVNGLTGGLNIVLNNTGNVSGTHTWAVSGTQTATIKSTAILSGAGGLTKTGTGTLVFEGANTYAGMTIVNAGELQLNATGTQSIAGNVTVNGGSVKLMQSAQINSASSLVVAGGAFNLQNFDQTLAGVRLDSGTISGSGTLTSTTAFDLRSGTVSGKLGGTAGLAKSTTGTVILSGINTYTGGTTVNSGILIAANSGALGTNNSLTIANGASFLYRPASNGALNLGTGALNLQGGSTIGTTLTGLPSQNAITSSATASAAGAVKVAVYFTPGVIVANGTHNLVTTGGGLTAGGATYSAAYYNLTNSTVSFQSTDTALSVNVASTTALAAAYWKGGLGIGSNVWALSDGTTSNWVTNANGTGATALVPGAGAAITFSATGATDQGAMVLGANMSIASLTVSDTNGITLNADGNTLTLSAAGGINVTAGAGAVTLNAGLNVGVNQSWTNNSSNTLSIGGPVVFNGTFTLTANGSGNTVISGALGGTGGVTKTGTGSLTLSGANTNTGALAVNGGRVNLSGGYQGAISVATGTNSRGMLNILTGASLTGTNMALGIGNGEGANGAVYQSGGDVLMNNNINLGLGGTSTASSYGFFSMSGGTLSDTNGTNVRFRMGGGGNYSNGVFYQSGGSISIAISNGLEVGGNGTGGFSNSTGIGYLTGGTFTAVSNRIGYNNTTNSTGGIRGEQTVAGTAVVTINGATTLGQGAGDVGILNLNGGLYVTRQITKGLGTSIVNFNGGTLKVATGTGAAGSFLTGLTQANVYSGGVRVDTNGINTTIAQVLAAPTGNGVSTIEVTNGGSGYVGPPIIVITGAGSGATAVANMVDDGTGNGTFKIASITITSAGTGYSSAPTVTLAGGGGTGAVVGMVNTSANTSGGITKTGNGNLTLTGANTYTGATVVETGVLIAGNASAFGVNSATTVNAGATLRLAGNGVTLGSLSGSGTVEDTTATAATLTLGSDGTSTNFSGVLQNGSGGGLLSVLKTGAGTQVFSGVNTYTGTTTINQGTLQIGHGGVGSTVAGSALTVNGVNAAVAGTGLAAGSVTVTSGFIRPGDNGGAATGTLNVGSLNLTAGGSGVLQIEGASSYDRINVVNSGGLTLNGNLNVTSSLTGNEYDQTFAIGATFNLLDWAGLMNGTFNVGTNFRNGSEDTGLQFDLPDLSALSRYWDVSQFLTDGTITVVVPEPGRAMLLLAGLSAVFLGRRRRCCK